MADWDNLVEPTRAALEALLRKGDAMAERIEEMERALAAARLALEAAEELHQVGILNARIGLPEEVVDRRSYALDVIRIHTGEPT